MLLYQSCHGSDNDGRVVELADSLDSGSSVHSGRAGSSPASPTKKDILRKKDVFLFITYSRFPLYHTYREEVFATFAICKGGKYFFIPLSPQTHW